MKNYKNFVAVSIISIILCLLPILLGIYLYSQLPDTIVVHWGINNEPNGWASKNFAVFGLPIMMAMFQLLICLVFNWVLKEKGLPKLGKIVIWLFPILTAVLYVATLSFALGNYVDMRVAACIIVSVIFIVFGNYLPKVPLEQNTKWIWYGMKDEKLYKRTMKHTAIVMILMGIFLLISLFFAEIYSIIIIGVSIVAIIAVNIPPLFKITRNKTL